MTTPLLWLVVGLVLVAAELVSGTFVLLMLGGGRPRRGRRRPRGRPGGQRRGVRGRVGAVAARAAPGAAPPAGPPASRTAVAGRGRGRGHGDGRSPASTGTAAGSGIGDDEWSARSFDEAEVIEPGERVTVVRIAGATALVLADR